MKYVSICLCIALFYSASTASAGTIRIINGNPARNQQFPWHVSIIGRMATGSLQLCGGSLIAADWVLTAGHCVVNMVSMELGFGTNILQEAKISLNVTEYAIHPQYDQSKKHHDIALIHLPMTIAESDTIKIIDLPRTAANVTYSSVKGIICGYGRYDDNDDALSRFLRWSHVEVIENSDCKRIYGDEVVAESTMCVVSLMRAGQNACNGDSGGSLVVSEGGSPKLVGVIAFAVVDRCGVGAPSGLMRVRPHLKWIYSVMSNRRKKYSS